jgi:hypothetical protein
MKKESNLLSAGAGIMAPVMERHGFVFSLEGEGHSSGGDFAYGTWGNRVRPCRFVLSQGRLCASVNQQGLTRQIAPVLRGVGSRKAPLLPGGQNKENHERI